MSCRNLYVNYKLTLQKLMSLINNRTHVKRLEKTTCNILNLRNKNWNLNCLMQIAERCSNYISRIHIHLTTRAQQ